MTAYPSMAVKKFWNEKRCEGPRLCKNADKRRRLRSRLERRIFGLDEIHILVNGDFEKSCRKAQISSFNRVFTQPRPTTDMEVPNDSVDMDSWESSACYPRRTFYPLSDGPPHVEPPDHYDRLSTLLDLSVSQSGKLMPLHSRADFRPA